MVDSQPSDVTQAQYLSTITPRLTQKQAEAYLKTERHPNKTHDELAADMGISRSTFTNHLGAARRELDSDTGTQSGFQSALALTPLGGENRSTKHVSAFRDTDTGFAILTVTASNSNHTPAEYELVFVSSALGHSDARDTPEMWCWIRTGSQTQDELVDAVEKLFQSLDTRPVNDFREILDFLDGEGFETDTATITPGRPKKRAIIQQTRNLLTDAGYDVSILDPDASSNPDVIGDIPFETTVRSLQHMRRKYAEISDKYPVMATLSDGQGVSVSVETLSSASKSASTIQSVGEAIETGRVCVFAVEDTGDPNPFEAVDRIFRTLSNPAMYRDITEDSVRRTYTKHTRLLLSDCQGSVVIPAGQRMNSEWRVHPNGSVELATKDDSTILLQFEDSETALNPSSDDVPAYVQYVEETDEFVVRKPSQGQIERKSGRWTYSSRDELISDWEKVSPPLLPEHEFSRTPNREDWKVVLLSPETDSPAKLVTCPDGVVGQYTTTTLSDSQLSH